MSAFASPLSSYVSSAPGYVSAVCPKALPGVGPAVDSIGGWIAYVFFTLVAIVGVAGVIMVIWGKVWHHPKGARLGMEVLLIVIVGAVLYVVFPGIPAAIASGCGTPAAG